MCRQRDVPHCAADRETDLAGKARELFSAGYVYPEHSRAALAAAAQDSADVARALRAARRCCRELRLLHRIPSRPRHRPHTAPPARRSPAPSAVPAERSAPLRARLRLQDQDLASPAACTTTKPLLIRSGKMGQAVYQARQPASGSGLSISSVPTFAGCSLALTATAVHPLTFPCALGRSPAALRLPESEPH